MGFLIRHSPGRHPSREFWAETDETLLAAALRQGLLFPYGCRDGVCGTCRGKVVSGKIDHGNASTAALSEADRSAGFALFCCARAQSDLIIECREVRPVQQILVRNLPARIQNLTLAAPDVMIVELKLPANDRLQFLPGQYIEILLKGGRRRAFSLANAPHGDALLQLHIRRVRGGQFTDHVFTAMKERDILRLSGPHGSFFLREDSSKPMLLVAGGTGFAPIKAIVEHVIAHKLSRPMSIYWGGRERADLYLQSVAEKWAQEHSNIDFVPVLSDTPQCEKWCGRIGFVHAAAMQDLPDLSGYQAYVCGSPEMVAAAKRDFVGKCELPEEEFFADSFEYANDQLPVALDPVLSPSNIVD